MTHSFDAPPPESLDDRVARVRDHLRERSDDPGYPLAFLRSVLRAWNDEQIVEAVECIARGAACPESVVAAAALCELRGLEHDPLDVAMELWEKPGHRLTEPQWFVWIAGYSYNWICNGGLSACYASFEAEQFEDWLRVYRTIGAEKTASVMQRADAAFGDDGPPSDHAARVAAMDDSVDAALQDLGPEFFACGDEIFTRAFLYALEHRSHFELSG